MSCLWKVCESSLKVFSVSFTLGSVIQVLHAPSIKSLQLGKKTKNKKGNCTYVWLLWFAKFLRFLSSMALDHRLLKSIYLTPIVHHHAVIFPTLLLMYLWKSVPATYHGHAITSFFGTNIKHPLSLSRKKLHGPVSGPSSGHPKKMVYERLDSFFYFVLLIINCWLNYIIIE